MQAAVYIQSCIRGYSVRKLLARQLVAAVCIQAEWRRCQAESRYRVVRLATLQLQALTRGRAAKQAYRQAQAATLLIQVCLFPIHYMFVY